MDHAHSPLGSSPAAVRYPFRRSSPSLILEFARPSSAVHTIRDTPAQHRKLRRAIIGVSFLQTETQALRAFQSWGVLRVIDQTVGTFHAKVALGTREAEARALIGSSNLTRGGFGPNTEVNVVLSGSLQEGGLAELLAFIDRTWEAASPVPDEWIGEYDEMRKVRPPPPRVPTLRRVPEIPKKPLVPPTPEQHPSAQAALVSLTTARFSPFGTRLPLSTSSTLRAGRVPKALLDLGVLCGEVVAGQPPRVAYHQGPQVFLYRAPGVEQEVWACGTGGLAIAGTTASQPSHDTPLVWPLPTGEWFRDDMCASFVECSLSFEPTDATVISYRNSTGNNQLVSANLPELDMRAILLEGAWVSIGTITGADRARLVGLTQAVPVLTRNWMLRCRPDGVFLCSGDIADGAEQELQVGAAVGRDFEVPFQRHLLHDALWPTPDAEIHFLPSRGLIALRFASDLALLGSSQAVPDWEPAPGVGLLARVRQERSSLTRPALSSFAYLFLESVRWVMSSPGSLPCATFELERGWVEIANFSNHPVGPELYGCAMGLNLALEKPVAALMDDADEILRRFGIAARSAFGTSSGVQAVSFGLQAFETPLEVVRVAEGILQFLWGRAPELGDVHSIQWRFLDTDSRYEEPRDLVLVRQPPREGRRGRRAPQA